MKVVLSCCELGMLPTNCYVVRDMQQGKSLVIDPAVYDNTLVQTLRKLEIEHLDYILLTHGHYDHILGVHSLKANFGGKLVIHADEAEFLSNAGLSLAHGFFNHMHTGVQADILVHEGDKLPFGGGEIEVLHTPGHTRGSVCYRLDDFLFCGDTIFRESVGRTDLPTGDFAQLCASIQRLAALKGDCKLFPGHGEATTLSHERINNPYLFYSL